MTDKYDRPQPAEELRKREPCLNEDIERLSNRVGEQQQSINSLETRISDLEGNMREVYAKIWDKDI